MRALHLTSSRFFGGPERQMLGLAQSMQGNVQTTFASFSETGLNQAFLNEVKDAGFAGLGLTNDTPNLLAARREIEQLINKMDIDVVACHGYKAGLIGWWAAQNTRIPAIAVSRGWTAENWKVRLYEKLDRFMLKRMDRVVCVSHAQAIKVANAGVDPCRIEVIHNSISQDRFAITQHSSERPKANGNRFRKNMLDFFTNDNTSSPSINCIVGAAGRLSPEKGFDVLVDAAKSVINQRSDIGFVLFGNGPERHLLSERIKDLNLEDRFILAGFTDSLDQFMPNFNLFVQSSHTEGLPNVLLEALAAGVPVVATDVGGTSELLDNGEYGKLVNANQADDLASAILTNLETTTQLQIDKAKQWVSQRFTFDQQAAAYQSLFENLRRRPTSKHPRSTQSASFQLNPKSTS